MKKAQWIYKSYVNADTIVYIFWFPDTWAQQLTESINLKLNHSYFIWGMEPTGPNFLTGAALQGAPSPEAAAVPLLLSHCLSLQEWVPSSFVLLSNVPAVQGSPGSSVSSSVPAPVCWASSPSCPCHCRLCLPSANMLCIHMCPNASHCRACTSARDSSGQASFRSISCFIYQDAALEIVSHHAGLGSKSGGMHPCILPAASPQRKEPKWRC